MTSSDLAAVLEGPEMVDGLTQVWAALIDAVPTVLAEEWWLPTPCGDWDVHDLLAHVSGSESMLQRLEQPPTPDGWESERKGVHYWTDLMVTARQHWSPAQILDEMQRASKAQLDELRPLDAEGWQQLTPGPLGRDMTRLLLAQVRLFDLYVHLLDLRFALGRPLASDDERLAVDNTVDLMIARAPWGAVKGAGLGDGSRIRLDLEAPTPRLVDVAVSDGKGTVGPPEGDATGVVSGSGLAFALVVTGRLGPAANLGLPTTEGADAEKFMDGYRFW